MCAICIYACAIMRLKTCVPAFGGVTKSTLSKVHGISCGAHCGFIFGQRPSQPVSFGAWNLHFDQTHGNVISGPQTHLGKCSGMYARVSAPPVTVWFCKSLLVAPLQRVHRSRSRSPRTSSTWGCIHRSPSFWQRVIVRVPPWGASDHMGVSYALRTLL